MRRRAVQLLGPALMRSPQFRRRASSAAAVRTPARGMARGCSVWCRNRARAQKPRHRAIGRRSVLVAESMVGTDVFGPYGCEDFVDAAHGLTTETGIAHDAALSFYLSLAARGLDHQ